ncbi:TPA: hypothetical protein BOS_4125 [Bos taurus]|nr:TPA: hypothetical protein BOS_4125 [Bos taurus]
MFVPAPVSEAAAALKEELTNGHGDGVANGAVFIWHPQRAEPRATGDPGSATVMSSSCAWPNYIKNRKER